MNGVSTQIDLDGHLRQIVSFPDTSSAGGSEGVDGILGPIFRDVLEHSAGREFTEQLEAFTDEKVGEIEAMCNSNHQEFVGAVEKLLKARQGASGLRRESILSHCFVPSYLLVIELNSDLQQSGNALTLVMRQHLESQTTLRNIDEAIETLQV
jgi:exocyst complex component 6